MIAFFNYLRSRRSALFGLDITSSSVKLIELSQKNSIFRVESYGVIPLPPDTVVDNRVHDPAQLSRAIHHLLTVSQPSIERAAIAISGSEVMTKIIQLDATLNEMELEAQIFLQEAPRFLPFPIEEASIDFEVIGKNANNPEVLDILVAAARTDSLLPRVKAVEATGISVAVVDSESYVMERVSHLTCDELSDQGTNQTIAIVDFGSQLTKMTILHNKENVFYREEQFGSSQLTQAIQAQYGLTFTQADLAKKQAELGNNYEEKILVPFQMTLISLIRRALQFFYSTSHLEHIDHMILAGGGALTTGLESVLAEQMGIPTSIANPFTSMTLSPDINQEHLNANAATLMMACGLALRSY